MIGIYEICAAISVLLKIFAYVPYFRDIFRGKCHPHAFSWFIWFVIIFIVFLVQLLGGAGIGSFTTLAAGLICLAVAVLGWFVGRRDISKWDWVAFVSAFALLPLWYVIEDPLMVVIIITLIDLIGYFPTWRKATLRPYEERSQTFFILSISSLFALFSLADTSLANMLYVAYLVVMHFATGTYVVWRHKVVSAQN